MTTMIGKGNQLVRRIRILRRDRTERVRQGVFLAEGIHLCQEALASGVELEQVVYSDRLSTTDEGAALLAALQRSGAVLDETSATILDSMQDVRSPQPVLSLVRMGAAAFDDLLNPERETALLVVAHDIQDPGNLGTIIRTADAAGATGLIATGSGVDLHHPRTVRSTMGSLFRLPTLHCPDILDVILRLEQERFWKVAAETGTGPRPEEVDWSRKTALFLGPERGGIPDEARSRMDSSLTIPMATGVDSLSVGAAAAVILFAARRVRNPAE
ncbi:MAG: RNA methyltransferase [Acidobacteria bacterium]|uniref:RNA methyltransferase n=1 Tax=Candidatus Polarisedimenticola svalbardensis TaxID=2886004 RepID=A0A8J6Y8M2_9BACT|nr:RNA methyltransferase [Candidatus Polarisedimenticola svalbardensis]